MKSEKCGRGGRIERKKVEKGGKGRESAVFNEGLNGIEREILQVGGMLACKIFLPILGV